MTLNSVGANIARAIGPALGGLIVAVAGSGPAILVNAISYLAVIMVLYRWRPSRKPRSMPAERTSRAKRAGFHYVWHSSLLRAVLIRAGLFAGCASALWATLPLLARTVLGLGAAGYGMLLGCFGAGAIAAHIASLLYGADFPPTR